MTDRVFITAAFIGTILWAFPHATHAQIVNDAPLVFSVNEISLANLAEPKVNYLAEVLAANLPSPIPDPRLEGLQTYLQTKKSPLAAESETLLEQYHYRLVIGISFAESNFCQKQIRKNNCWGIGGGYPESYPTLADGITRANNLIQKYHAGGLTTPKLMRNRWVGWKNDSWISAVEQVVQQLEENGL